MFWVALAALIVSVIGGAVSYYQSQNTGVNTGLIESDRQRALDLQDQQAQAARSYADTQQAMLEDQRRMASESAAQLEEERATAAREEEQFNTRQQRRLSNAAGGRRSTILTTGLGSTAQVGTRTLLGE